MRSIWKGHIRFSLVTIPVRVYNAIETSESISFNQLHRDCGGRVAYEKRCKKCEQKLTNEQIVKGYQYEPDQYAVVEASDLEKVKLKSTKIIELAGFVEATEVPATWYESPYFAGPDGTVAEQPYALLRDALRAAGKVGVGKVVLRDREDAVLIAPEGQGIILYRLRYPEEVRSVQEVPQVENSAQVTGDALKLANSLIETMTTSLDQIELKDRYQTALKEVIQAKIDGKETILAEEPEPVVVDIMAALKASIEAAKAQRKPLVKSEGKAAKAARATRIEEEKPKQRKRKAA